MVVFDFTGEENKKVFPKYEGIPEDWYEAEITKISDVFKQQKYKADPGVMEEKIAFTFKINGLHWKSFCVNADEVTEEPECVEILWTPRTLVKKNKAPYSNSKMYNFLEEAGLLEGMKKVRDEIVKLSDENQQNALYADFLRKNLIGKKFRIFIDKTVNGRPKITKVKKLVENLNLTQTNAAPEV